MSRSTWTALAIALWMLSPSRPVGAADQKPSGSVLMSEGGIGDRPGEHRDVVVSVTSPPTGTRTASATILLTGTVSAGTEGIREVSVAVNGRVLPAGTGGIRFTGRGAVVGLPVPLEPGENILTLTSIDSAGVPFQKAVTVYRLVPPPPSPPASTPAEPVEMESADHRDPHRERDVFINRWGDDHGDAMLPPGCRR